MRALMRAAVSVRGAAKAVSSSLGGTASVRKERSALPGPPALVAITRTQLVCAGRSPVRSASISTEPGSPVGIVPSLTVLNSESARALHSASVAPGWALRRTRHAAWSSWGSTAQARWAEEVVIAEIGAQATVGTGGGNVLKVSGVE